jgi:hypothetical protein
MENFEMMGKGGNMQGKGGRGDGEGRQHAPSTVNVPTGAQATPLVPVALKTTVKPSAVTPSTRTFEMAGPAPPATRATSLAC